VNRIALLDTATACIGGIATVALLHMFGVVVLCYAPFCMHITTMIHVSRIFLKPAVHHSTSHKSTKSYSAINVRPWKKLCLEINVLF